MEESLVETQVLELRWGSRYKERKKPGTRFHVHCVLVFLQYPCEKMIEKCLGSVNQPLVTSWALGNLQLLWRSLALFFKITGR